MSDLVEYWARRAAWTTSTTKAFLWPEGRKDIIRPALLWAFTTLAFWPLASQAETASEIKFGMAALGAVSALTIVVWIVSWVRAPLQMERERDTRHKANEDAQQHRHKSERTALQGQVRDRERRIQELIPPPLDLTIVADTVYFRLLEPGDIDVDGYKKMAGYELTLHNVLVTNRSLDRNVVLLFYLFTSYNLIEETRLQSQVRDGSALVGRDIEYWRPNQPVTVGPGDHTTVNLRYLEPAVRFHSLDEPLYHARFFCTFLT